MEEQKSIYSKGAQILIIAGAVAYMIFITVFSLVAVNRFVDKPRPKNIVNEQIEENKDNNANELDEECKQILYDYYEGNISYEDAYDRISEIKNNKYSYTLRTEQYLEQLNKHHEELLVFNQAEYYYDEGDYVNAYLNYSEIKEGSNMYKEAKQKKDDCYNKYFAPIFDEVRALCHNGEYGKALDIINEQEESIGNTQAYAELKVLYEYEVAARDIIENANFIYEEQGYKELCEYFKFILFSQQEYSNLIDELKEHYGKMYKVDAVAEFNDLYDKGDFVNALWKLCDTIISLESADGLDVLYNKPGLYNHIVEIADYNVHREIVGEYGAMYLSISAMNRFFAKIERINVSCLHHDETGKIFVYDISFKSDDPGYPLADSIFQTMAHTTKQGYSTFKECSGTFILKSVEFEGNAFMKVWENPEYEKWVKDKVAN